VRKSSALAGLVLSSALVLAACGSDDAGGGDDDTAAPDGGESTCLADLPAEGEDEPLTPTEGASGVEVSGSFGDKPELVIPDADPAVELTVEVLSEGDGSELSACDLVTVDYLGQTWEAAEDAETPDFDNSFDREDPFRLNLGLGQVIAGWDAALQGQKVGSRVLLSIPPEHAYGELDEDAEEGTQHELAGETLLFVVDIVDSISASAGISGDEVSDLPADVPAVTGDGAGAEPELDLEGIEPVAESDAVLLVAGDGEDLQDFLVVNVLQVSYLTGETMFSTWANGQGPLGTTAAPLTAADLPGLADALDGQKVGSRVVVRISAEDNPAAPEPEATEEPTDEPDAEATDEPDKSADDEPTGEPLAIVLDIVGTY
jgi:FKBP-type peptidyl-prolyl cis-trans isomerase 2